MSIQVQEITEAQLIGTWRCADAGFTCDWTFCSDGTFQGDVISWDKSFSKPTGRWRIRGAELRYTYTGDECHIIRAGKRGSDTLLEVTEDYFVIETKKGIKRKYVRVRPTET